MTSLFLTTPEPMYRVRMVTMKDLREKALKSLQRTGVLHVEVSEELSPVDTAFLEQHKNEVSELLTLINDVLAIFILAQRPLGFPILTCRRQ